MWEDCLVEFAARYKDNPLVAGMDLRYTRTILLLQQGDLRCTGASPFFVGGSQVYRGNPLVGGGSHVISGYSSMKT